VDFGETVHSNVRKKKFEEWWIFLGGFLKFPDKKEHGKNSLKSS
jgi:hypothetical protein